MSKIDANTETRIVAMIARGDTYGLIQDTLTKEGISLSPSGISDIKKRNAEALSYIQGKLTEHQLTHTSRILEKARNQIEKKLDAADGNVPVLQELIELRNDGEIDDAEYARLSLAAVQSHALSVKDLTSVAKEMFNQSQIEAGKPTSITENPEQAKLALAKILDAINKGDDKAIAEAIFLDV